MNQPTKPIVLITGSSGLIGKAVAENLLGSYQVVGLDREGDPYPPPQVECICFDLTDDASIGRAMERVRYAYGDRIASVIHLAAYYDFSGEPSPLYEKVTVRGTQRLLRALKDFTVEQFVFSSTLLVHAPGKPGQPITEDWPVEPKWDYPQSKVDTEKIIVKEHGPIPYVIQRMAGIYTDECDSIPISHQIQRIYERQMTGRVYPGDTDRGQPFLHLDDLVDAVRRTIDRRADLPSELTLLLGEPETYSYEQLQRELARLIHGEEDWQTTQIPKPVAKTGAWVQDAVPGIEEPFIKSWMVDLADDHYELDISRAQRLLGWNPRERLIATLPKMIESLRRDPEVWYRRHKLGTPPPAVDQPTHVGQLHA